MKTKRLLNSHTDTKVLRALEWVAMSMVGHQIKPGGYILELHSAWQVIHTMRGNESNEGESHFIPIVVGQHIDKLVNAVLIATHPLSLWDEWS